AIAAVERHLAESGGDGNALELKRLLYRDLTEAEYQEAAGLTPQPERPPQPVGAEMSLPEAPPPPSSQAEAVLATVRGVAGSARAAAGGTMRDLAEKAGAAVPWSLKSFLNRSVGGVVRRIVGGGAPAPLPHFDYTYVREIGLTLVKDPEKW